MTHTIPSILVVDDDPDCLEFARTVLAHHYTVRTASSGDQCRKEIKTQRPDLLLLDVIMGHLSEGLDLAKELKEAPETNDIPVIMMTNVNDVYDYRTQVDASFFPHDRWLDKPVKPDILLKAVGDILEKSGKP